MRKIKFRAYSERIGMFNVDVLSITEGMWDCGGYLDGKKRIGMSIAHQPHLKLMQFTGHYCHGKEIYEGDILSTYCYNKLQKGAVVFGRDGWTCMGYYLDTAFFIGGGDDFKIIGNIYENQNLLQSENS